MDISKPRDIQQVGYHVTQGTFWAAYFAPADPEGEIVYALDTTSGLDVLHIEWPDAGMKPAGEAELGARTAWGTPSKRWATPAGCPARRCSQAFKIESTRAAAAGIAWAPAIVSSGVAGGS